MDATTTSLIDASTQMQGSVERATFKTRLSSGGSFAAFARVGELTGSVFVPGGTEYRSNLLNVSYEVQENSLGYSTGRGAARRKIFEEAHDKFIEIASSEYFEYGYTPPSENFIAEFARDYPGILGELIQSISLSQARNAKVMVALLNAIGSLRYEDVRPYGQVLAIAAVSNLAVDVKEAAIRVYETWGHPEGATVLAAVECPWPWLDDYRKQVMADLGAGR